MHEKSPSYDLEAHGDALFQRALADCMLNILLPDEPFYPVVRSSSRIWLIMESSSRSLSRQTRIIVSPAHNKALQQNLWVKDPGFPVHGRLLGRSQRLKGAPPLTKGKRCPQLKTPPELSQELEPADARVRLASRISGKFHK